MEMEKFFTENLVKIKKKKLYTNGRIKALQEIASFIIKNIYWIILFMIKSLIMRQKII